MRHEDGFLLVWIGALCNFTVRGGKSPVAPTHSLESPSGRATSTVPIRLNVGFICIFKVYYIWAALTEFPFLRFVSLV